MLRGLMNNVTGRSSSIGLMALVLLSVGFADQTFASKSDQERESAYQTISESYDAKNWEETLLLIDRFRNKYPHSDREASLMLLSAECNLKLRRLDRAESLASQIILQFPDVNFTGRARLVLGECALLAGDWNNAELNFAWIISFSSDSSAVVVARERLAELQAFLKAREEVPAQTSELDPPKIALVLPVTGALSSESDNFLTGFRFAWKSTGFPEPLLFDSEADPVKAVRLFGEIARDHRPWGIVGGLSVAEATGLAAFSQSVQIPFLSTTCGVDGLASISQFVIQGRADYGGLAGSLGKFASLNMGLKKLAILYVNNVSGRQMAKEFREQVELNGGAIHAEVMYYPGTIDFSNNLLQLKNSFIRYAYEDSLNTEFATRGHLFLNDAFYVPTGKDINIQSYPGHEGTTVYADGRLSNTFLDSLWTAERRTHRWTAESSHDFDSSSIELPDLEGLFVVIEPGMIEMIAPQLTRNRLNRQVFGNEAWDDRDALRKVQSYMNGLVYVSPLAPVNDSIATKLASTAIAQGDKGVNSWHFAGERAARIIEATINRAKSNAKFRDAITTLSGVETLSGKVTFVKEERVDRSQSIILFKDDNFIRVDE